MMLIDSCRIQARSASEAAARKDWKEFDHERESAAGKMSWYTVVTKTR